MDFRKVLSTIKKPFIIGIAGDSGSGKTTYSNGIRRLLGLDLVKTITLDGYHKENRRERLETGHLPLDPSFNKLDLLLKHLTMLKENKSVEIPIYNHQTGDFEKPSLFHPSPIIILEGLFTLYPEFLPFLDFTIYVDPCREVKWQWKYFRDIEKRGYEKKELNLEMLKRETAYKRYIDFQKTNAMIVVKILPSIIKDFARYELIEEIPPFCYKVELIMESSCNKLPSLPLVNDLSDLLSISGKSFLLAIAPSYYWGKKMVTIHLDGVIPQKTVEALENHIFSITGIPVTKMLEGKNIPTLSVHEHITAVQLAQLLIGWRFLELISCRFT